MERRRTRIEFIHVISSKSYYLINYTEKHRLFIDNIRFLLYYTRIHIDVVQNKNIHETLMKILLV